MTYIDYIYYTATSTDTTTGYVTVINSQYYVPFLDFLLILFVLSFTIYAVGFAKSLMYPDRLKFYPRVFTKVFVKLKK